jgi:hypothetical protein
LADGFVRENARVLDPAREIPRVVDFLRSVGVPVAVTDTPADSFLPGVRVGPAGLTVFPPAVEHPHDLFHEAGHLAVIPRRFWSFLPDGADFGDPGAPFSRAVDDYLQDHPEGLTSFPEDPVCRAVIQMGEVVAIAWSYAAMVAASCDLDAYWHPPFDGFGGEAPDVYVSLWTRSHMGVHGLQARKMTTVRTFPHMTHWICA